MVWVHLYDTALPAGLISTSTCQLDTFLINVRDLTIVLHMTQQNYLQLVTSFT